MNFSEYIGLPYKHKGRGPSGVDCLGLFRMIYQNELGIKLPDYTDKNIDYEKDWYKSEDHLVPNINNIFTKISKPYKPFDGLIFFNGSNTIASHLGLVISSNKFVHVFEGVSSRVDRLSGYWESKLYFAMRYING